ncbi:unnamed protein product [Prunus armeniaca]
MWDTIGFNTPPHVRPHVVGHTWRSTHVEPCRDSPITRGHIWTHPITWHLWAYVEPCRDSPIAWGQMGTHPITWQNGPAPGSDTSVEIFRSTGRGPTPTTPILSPLNHLHNPQV